jgi:hypothetical protein
MGGEADTQRSAWDAVSPGDPRPPLHDSWPCMATTPSLLPGFPWTCTRAEKHDGQHVATDRDSVIAAWEAE